MEAKCLLWVKPGSSPSSLRLTGVDLLAVARPFAVARSVNPRRTHPDLPIMVITGHTTIGEDQNIIVEGASVVLKKPIDLHELSQRMRQMVGQYYRCSIILVSCRRTKRRRNG